MLLPHILSTILLLIIQVNTDDLPCIFSPNNVSSTKRSCNKFNHTYGPVLVSRRRFRRQAGRSGLQGCGNSEIKSIMERVMPPLLNGRRMKIGDIAKRLQVAVQQATGKSYEIFMGKGDMQVATHLMEDGSSCKQRVGEFFTTVYETPIQYNIFNLEQEQFLSNIDFGEPLGGSGYPGQQPFARLVEPPTSQVGGSNGGQGGSGNFGQSGRGNLGQGGRGSLGEDGRGNLGEGGRGSLGQDGEGGDSDQSGRQSGGPGQGGRGGLSGCGNPEIKSIMERVMPPLLNSGRRMKVGDIAKRLQTAVQQATGKSFEIFMGKGDMMVATHLMDDGSSCRQRVGEFYTTVYETPVQYDIFNLEQEQFLSNIDFGEPLGGSGYPGQEPFPHLVQPPAGEAGSNALGEGNSLGEAGRAGSEQAGRGRANAEPDGGPSGGGCDNAQLRGIMNRVVPPLLNAPQRMRIGDIARRLQLAVQQETGKSFEIFMGPSEMTFSSHQMSAGTSCRQQIGEYYTTVYETPVQYNIFDAAEEQFMANIDFGQELGSTGYPGQIPFPQYTELVPFNALLQAPLQGPLWPQYYPPVANPVAAPPVYYPTPPVFAQMECFSADMMVETIEGAKRMDELKTGDRVLSIDETMISFSPIVMFLHRDEELMAEFNVITTANGKSVKLTNEHLIFVSDCDIKNTLRLVKAKEVTTDNCVMSSQTSRRTLNVDRVTNITKVYERGIFAPLTKTGDIIANDILSSCHSNLGVRTLQQSVFTVYRALYRSLSFFLPEEGSLPVGLAYLASTLDLFLPSKANF